MTSLPDLPPDSPAGDLIDNLVADVIDAANRHVRIASESVERLTAYPALAERYGDFNLGIDWHGNGGRQMRADIHRALREKGMSLRAIAAETGASVRTVHRDVADATPITHEDVANATPHETEPPKGDVPISEPAMWEGLLQLMDALEAFSDAERVAATIPERRRAATAKRLRKLGTYLGRIAWTLEGKVGDQ